VPVLIPEGYVPDLDVRLGLYRRLSDLHGKVELEGFAAELIDRFGKLPPEVDTLLKIVRIKTMCKRAGIARLDGGPKGATVQFHNDKFANPAGLADFMLAQKGLAKVKDNRIVIRRDWATEGHHPDCSGPPAPPGSGPTHPPAAARGAGARVGSPMARPAPIRRARRPGSAASCRQARAPAPAAG
jgi:hypothetical protein